MLFRKPQNTLGLMERNHNICSVCFEKHKESKWHNSRLTGTLIHKPEMSSVAPKVKMCSVTVSVMADGLFFWKICAGVKCFLIHTWS